MVDTRKPLNVKIPTELYQKIENEGRQNQDVVTDALQLYFSSASNIDVARDLEHCQEKVRLLEANIKDIQQASGIYIQEIESWKRLSEKVLYPSQEEIKEKKWWIFWKK